MPVKIEAAEDTVTACIMGEIDHHSAKEIREEIDSILESAKPATLVMDFRDVSFMDSSGIGLIMGRYKVMQSLQGRLRVVNVSSHMKKVMRLAGLDRLAVIEN